MQNILVKPIISEKNEKYSSKLGRYAFVVARKANKLQVKQAVEKMFNVKVADVNTLVVPARIRNRATKAGTVQGRIGAYKKAYVTLQPGETIDFYNSENTPDEQA
jgi:large subunit ribosomal protein L23